LIFHVEETYITYVMRLAFLHAADIWIFVAGAVGLGDKLNDNGVREYHRQIASVESGVNGFFVRNFTETHIDGPKLDPEDIQKSPVMFVSTHRSHVDYFLAGISFFKMGFRNIRFAAGDNLTRLPYIGPRFLAFGAFAVSRDGGFERNYVRNLCAQVMKMLEDGDAVLVFPEGGRSYTGSMLDIKGGVLNAALMTQAANPDRDVYLLPAAISYECPPDVPFFPMLLKGKKLRKKPNNIIKRLLGGAYYFGADIMAFAPLMFKCTSRKRGAVYMDYGAPVPVRSLVDLEANRVKNARDEFSAHRVSLDIVGERIRKMLVSIYRVLPIHIVSSVLKARGGNIAITDMDGAAEELKALALKSGRNCKTIGGMTAPEIVKAGLDQLRGLKAVSVKNGKITVLKTNITDYFAATFTAAEETEA